MESRSKKKLMMLKDKNNWRTKETDANSDNTFCEGNECNKITTISNKNSSIDLTAKKMVETWIDKNIKNQDCVVTVSNINDDTTICFFWHEGLGKRGANEIGTCLYKFLEELSNKQPDKDIIFYSDNCCGQQKNKFVFGMYYYVVNTLPINSITHKFLIRGHTQNKADAVHCVIEKNVKRAKKAGPIYTPAEYISLIKNAKKKGNQFTVKEMNFDSFIDMKMLSNDIKLNVNKNVDGNTFKISDIKAIKFTKDSEMYQYKCSYKLGSWTEAKIRTGRIGNKKGPEDITLNQLYNEKLSIPDRKKEDISQLINSNIVPKFYEQYFNNLF